MGTLDMPKSCRAALELPKCQKMFEQHSLAAQLQSPQFNALCNAYVSMVDEGTEEEREVPSHKHAVILGTE